MSFLSIIRAAMVRTADFLTAALMSDALLRSIDITSESPEGERDVILHVLAISLRECSAIFFIKHNFATVLVDQFELHSTS